MYVLREFLKPEKTWSIGSHSSSVEVNSDTFEAEIHL